MTLMQRKSPLIKVMFYLQEFVEFSCKLKSLRSSSLRRRPELERKMEDN